MLSPLPLGTSDFSVLRESGEIYVDKTDLIYQLAQNRARFFGSPEAIRKIAFAFNFRIAF